MNSNFLVSLVLLGSWHTLLVDSKKDEGNAEGSFSGSDEISEELESSEENITKRNQGKSCKVRSVVRWIKAGRKGKKKR